MTEQVASDSPEDSIVRWMWHWPFLFAALAAPFFVFESESAGWVSIAIGVAYGLWCVRLPHELWSAIRRPKRERSMKKYAWTVEFLVAILQICAPIMTFGTMLIWCVGWVSWVYDVDSAKLNWSVLVVFLFFILSPALFLVLAPAFGRENGGPASQFLKGIRDRGFGPLHLYWFGESAISLGLLCLLPIMAFSLIHEVATTLNLGDIVPIWDLAIAFPVLPATLLAAAVLLSAPRISLACHIEDSVLARTYMDGDPVPPGLNSRARKVLGLVVVGGAVATLFVLIYPLHLGWVAWGSSIMGVTPLIETMESVDSSVATQRRAGRSTAAIAAELNRIGSWTPDAPDAGLATLVEEPDSVFVDTCSLRLAAGVTNPAAHGAFDWLPTEQAVSDLKYCIAVSCDSPVPWDAPPALLLASSHDSQAAHWSARLFIDIFADGAATAPGGYCTTDGRLAGEFQG